MNKILIVAVCFASNLIFAGVNPKEESEIDYLIQFVGSSLCKINRNGKFHESGDAVSHIQKKYEYFRDEIETAEQFIEYSATKSTVSGKYYWVKCGDSPSLKTRDWLLNELKRYRGRKRI